MQAQPGTPKNMKNRRHTIGKPNTTHNGKKEEKISYIGANNDINHYLITAKVNDQ